MDSIIQFLTALSLLSASFFFISAGISILVNLFYEDVKESEEK